MKLRSTLSAVLLATLLPIGAFAQGPDGKDYGNAIPIYFDQTVTDIVDGKTNPAQIYKIALAKGQSFSVTFSSPTTSS